MICITLWNIDFVFGLWSIISEIFFDAENDAVFKICLSCHISGENWNNIGENWLFLLLLKWNCGERFFIKHKPRVRSSCRYECFEAFFDWSINKILSSIVNQMLQSICSINSNIPEVVDLKLGICTSSRCAFTDAFTDARHYYVSRSIKLMNKIKMNNLSQQDLHFSNDCRLDSAFCYSSHLSPRAVQMLLDI